MANEFCTFLGSWLERHDSLLQKLESLVSPSDGLDKINKECKNIIPHVFSHYQQLYEEKTKAANEDVFLLMSPPWLSSFERALLWVSGFRPSLLFKLLETSVGGQLSVDQKDRVDSSRSETRRKEWELTNAMARVQETVAEPPFYHMARKFANLVDGERSDFEEAVERLKAAMLVVMAQADELRRDTAAGLVEMLDPVQGVHFLAAAVRFEIRARKWGLEKDAKRSVGSSTDQNVRSD